jgi:hypothetical protein
MIVAFMLLHNFSFVLMCAHIFYFAYRNCLKFKFDLNSNEFAKLYKV